MKKTIAAAALAVMAFSLPVQQASAQDVLGGAILGGAAGAIIGGAATGRAGGAAVGAAIGATTGALIANESQRRRSGYYWWRNGCYYKDGRGNWYRTKTRNCY
ncbi:MAG: glycine zipper domain-containing protein [Siculibacillus sp.]|nr:glycine zipper domain-containing protein [Siculibacillus sp.]